MDGGKLHVTRFTFQVAGLRSQVTRAESNLRPATCDLRRETYDDF